MVQPVDVLIKHGHLPQAHLKLSPIMLVMRHSALAIIRVELPCHLHLLEMTSYFCESGYTSAFGTNGGHNNSYLNSSL